jgi:cell division protease FtsH
LELPDLRGREAILEVHLKRVQKEDDLDVNLVARMTAGASGAQLANIVNEAALRAVRMARNVVTTTDLTESVETIIAGPERKNAILSEKEKRIVAYHEIGHALVAAKQSGSAPVQKITIVPRTSGALGYTMQVEENEKSLISKEDAFQRLEVLCGGRAAEEVVFNMATTGAANDIEKATDIARNMVTRYGMSENFGMMALETGGNTYLGHAGQSTCSPETVRLVDEEIRDIIAEAHRRATTVLMGNREKMDDLAEYLLEKEVVDEKAARVETMILGLRLLQGVSRSRFKCRHNIDCVDVFGEEIAYFEKSGLLECSEDAVRLSSRGLDFADLVVRAFL